MLVERPELVHGLDVLEIGAGTGLCGILAAKLGAAKVTLPSVRKASLWTHCFAKDTSSWTGPRYLRQPHACQPPAQAKKGLLEPVTSCILSQGSWRVCSDHVCRCQPVLRSAFLIGAGGPDRL